MQNFRKLFFSITLCLLYSAFFISSIAVSGTDSDDQPASQNACTKTFSIRQMLAVTAVSAVTAKIGGYFYDWRDQVVDIESIRSWIERSNKSTFSDKKSLEFLRGLNPRLLMSMQDEVGFYSAADLYDQMLKQIIVNGHVQSYRFLVRNIPRDKTQLSRELRHAWLAKNSSVYPLIWAEAERLGILPEVVESSLESAMWWSSLEGVDTALLTDVVDYIENYNPEGQIFKIFDISSLFDFLDAQQACDLLKLDHVAFVSLIYRIDYDQTFIRSILVDRGKHTCWIESLPRQIEKSAKYVNSDFVQNAKQVNSVLARNLYQTYFYGMTEPEDLDYILSHFKNVPKQKKHLFLFLARSDRWRGFLAVYRKHIPLESQADVYGLLLTVLREHNFEFFDHIVQVDKIDIQLSGPALLVDSMIENDAKAVDFLREKYNVRIEVGD